MSSLARLGLTEAKIVETEKNASLTASLNNILSQADDKKVEIDRTVGTLMYNLATKLKKQEHLPMLLDLVFQKKVNFFKISLEKSNHNSPL